MTWKLDGGFVVFSFPLFFSILFFLTEKTRFSFSAASAFLLSLLLYVFFIHVGLAFVRTARTARLQSEDGGLLHVHVTLHHPWGFVCVCLKLLGPSPGPQGVGLPTRTHTGDGTRDPPTRLSSHRYSHQLEKRVLARIPAASGYLDVVRI